MTTQSPHLTRLADQQREQFIQDGYVVVSGLIPEDAIVETRGNLLAATGMRQEDPATWDRGATVLADQWKLTLPCWSDAMLDCAAELTGPQITRDRVFSPFREQQGQDPQMAGYIPVLNYPVPGPAVFEPPTGAHIDGLHRAALFPTSQYLVVFAYLTETPAYGGATAVWPGSHRRLFMHWLARGAGSDSTIPDRTFDLELGSAVPMAGHAGDVIFMHYLLVHSGSANHAGHIRIGLNSAIQPDPAHPYVRKCGPPRPDWTPIDWTLRTDDL